MHPKRIETKLTGSWYPLQESRTQNGTDGRKAPASRSWLLFLEGNKDFNQDAEFLGGNINIYAARTWPPALSPEIPDGRDLA